MVYHDGNVFGQLPDHTGGHAEYLLAAYEAAGDAPADDYEPYYVGVGMTPDAGDVSSGEGDADPPELWVEPEEADARVFAAAAAEPDPGDLPDGAAPEGEGPKDWLRHKDLLGRNGGLVLDTCAECDPSEAEETTDGFDLEPDRDGDGVPDILPEELGEDPGPCKDEDGRDRADAGDVPADAEKEPDGARGEEEPCPQAGGEPCGVVEEGPPEDGMDGIAEEPVPEGVPEEAGTDGPEPETAAEPAPPEAPAPVPSGYWFVPAPDAGLGTGGGALVAGARVPGLEL